MSKLVDSASNILETFPGSLARDDDKQKLAAAISDKLAELMHETDKAAIFPAIDKLDAEMLDILASDFKCEWYDSSGTLEEKRKTIKDCLFMHRYKGTKFAVETALRSIYETVKVSEWFEYGGEPYHFRVEIFDSSNDTEKRQRILSKIEYYKNLRSVLDDVIFKAGANADLPITTAIKSGTIYKKIDTEVMIYGLD